MIQKNKTGRLKGRNRDLLMTEDID